jgi:hypothetical protein
MLRFKLETTYAKRYVRSCFFMVFLLLNLISSQKECSFSYNPSLFLYDISHNVAYVVGLMWTWLCNCLKCKHDPNDEA